MSALGGEQISAECPQWVGSGSSALEREGRKQTLAKLHIDREKFTFSGLTGGGESGAGAAKHRVSTACAT
jgi:hypothetical protein